MSLLSAAEITQMRADLDGMLPDTAVIGRYTRTPDGGGAFSESWPTVATLPCRLTRIRARMTAEGAFRNAGGRLDDDTTHTVTFTHGTDVRLQDHVTIGSAVFEVLSIRSGGAWELARHAEVKAMPV